ncbi:PhnD/SsuA/transferrin family substrate-binding protein [Lyngbya confervoides]|uniref:PhnD/SsuA/transferrin family substrate-binding protein n=1 Tax=Lyngbya confervoides BDU141951 TaxID=1574623 RepID=A0ABD4T5Z1_9CYAN|nr:PhnD/SsuA/transferrin family substrate-binding protein [Lyngbya confervoides]MCM1983975.1 PhnD/SsuA/transferrin family substrate-binding protein [Lyngbya confervoides BDU141951]
MARNSNDVYIVKVLPILDKNFELLKLGKSLADERCNFKLDFSGVDSLNETQQRLLFKTWSKLSDKVRRDITDFVCCESINEQLGEIFDAIARDPSRLNSKFDFCYTSFWFVEKKYRLILTLIFVGIFASLGVSFWQFQKSYRVESSEIIFGTILDPEKLTDLETYLEETLVPNNFVDYLWNKLRNKKINVVVEGRKDISYKVAEYKIKNKQWDIFFASSPILSIKSKDNQYSWGFKMFPENRNDTYTSGFFVRSNSNIEGIDQINSSTKIALGEILQSASSFVVPVYELFGKTIKVSTGHRGHEIVEMVKAGNAEVGAAAITDNRIEKDSQLRLIFQSRAIPGSGVYFSPKLSNNDSANLKKAMEAAPKSVQRKANYGSGQEPDYKEFKTIMQTVDEILVCADFSKEDVNLFCPKGFKPRILVGKVHGWKAEQNNYVLYLKEENNGSTLNHVVMDKAVFRSIFEVDNPHELHGKRLKTMTPESKNATREVSIFFVKSAAQIEMLD